jgi:hypothetical protein
LKNITVALDVERRSRLMLIIESSEKNKEGLENDFHILKGRENNGKRK